MKIKRKTLWSPWRDKPPLPVEMALLKRQSSARLLSSVKQHTSVLWRFRRTSARCSEDSWARWCWPARRPRRSFGGRGENRANLLGPVFSHVTFVGLRTGTAIGFLRESRHRRARFYTLDQRRGGGELNHLGASNCPQKMAVRVAAPIFNTAPFERLRAFKTTLQNFILVPRLVTR